MKIQLETNVEDKIAPQLLDTMLNRIVRGLEYQTGLHFDVRANGQVVRIAHKAKLLRKKANRAEAVAYDATDAGWKVVALDINGRIVDSEEDEVWQHGGPDEPGLSEESNIATARRRAERLADELGIDYRRVYHEQGLASAF